MNTMIIPTSQRAKNRVNEHGSEMEVLAGRFVDGIAKILVKSLENTWSGEKWMGWFSEDEIRFNDEVKTLFRCNFNK